MLFYSQKPAKTRTFTTMKTGFIIGILIAAVAFASYRVRLQAEEIPRTWDEEKLHTLHLPLADSSISVKTVSADYYYKMPVYTPFRTYPFYLPGREPKGYFEWLSKQEASLVFEENNLMTEEDWIKAGEAVFKLPAIEVPMDSNFFSSLTELGKNWERIGVPVLKDGTIPFFNIVVKESGKSFLGIFSCAMCHTKVMDDGQAILGAQGNYPFGQDLPIVLAYGPQSDSLPAFTKELLPSLFLAPWIKHQSQQIWNDLESEYNRTVIPDFKSVKPGVMHRHSAMIGFPTVIPDLFDLKDRKYFDRTGLLRNRDIGDVMRYAALNQGLDFLNTYGDYTPRAIHPDPSQSRIKRYSDRQLYALARFIYALKPPVNPTSPDRSLVVEGEKIFMREGCSDCHTPPLYTSNRLTPAKGFKIPEYHFKEYDIYDECLETDPGLALYTRRGTGYYKIPSLRHAWNRSAFLHGGYCATLEEMFDKKRLSDDYIPQGYKPANKETMAITGHQYGLDLNDQEKKMLIAFIRSL